MTRERIFYIAYEICSYLKNREMQNQFENYELCMYVADLAGDIEHAVHTGDDSFLEQYYKVLYEELDNFRDVKKYKEEIEHLIDMLNEWKI